jgi:hypothetical protein
VVETLRDQGYGIHVILEADGTAVQTAALDSHQYHAGEFSPVSIGIETVGPGTGPNAGARPNYVDTIHGDRVRYAGLTPAQKRALPQILAKISTVTGVPVRAVSSSTVLPTQTLATYRGVVGHYQLTANKFDPGPAVIREVTTMRRSPAVVVVAVAAAAAGAALLVYALRS